MIDFQWLIGGEAGYGIMTTGLMMSKILTRLGLSVFDYVEYPSLIRGGHNAYYVRASDEEIYSQKKTVDILVALNRDTVEKHKDELSEKGVIVYDPGFTKIEEGEFDKGKLIPVPFLEIVKKLNVDKLMVNTVAVGASLALFYPDFKVLEDLMRDTFAKKGEKVVLENINCSKEGFDFVQKNFSQKKLLSVANKTQENILISGAEAVAIGAIKAGLKFAAIYPMTPINAILTTLSSNAISYNIVVKEPEDEISGINMAIGASYAGVRSMVATSGGGFSLMVESLGLAAQTETPLVIVMGQRPGPATGFPTWTGQQDLRFVIHAAQGEFPRIIFAPGDMLEAFHQTILAFNLAEKYQVPVIVLVDKYLMEGHATVNKSQISDVKYQIEKGKNLKDEELESIADYKRYELTEDGVSKRSLPGQKGGISLTGSDEHDERGLYNEEAQNRIKMMDKRFKKMDKIIQEIPKPQPIGSGKNQIGILSFGSTKLPVLDALKELKKGGLEIDFMHIPSIEPFPENEVSSFINSHPKTLIIEGNKTGQLEGLIREKIGLTVTSNFRKYDGRPFYFEEIVEKVKSAILS